MSERTLTEPLPASAPADGTWDQVTMTASSQRDPGHCGDGGDQAHDAQKSSPGKTRKKPIVSFTKRMEYVEAKAARHAGEPDNWFSRKAMVGIVLALVIWSYYVVVGRVCAPMIQRRANAGGSLGEGVGLLIGFNVLWLMFVWTYLKLILTDPGFAKELPGFATQQPEHGNGTLNANADGSAPPSAHHLAPTVPLSVPNGMPPATATTSDTAQDASPSSVAGMYSPSETEAHPPDPEEEAAERAGTLDGLRNMWPSELPVPEMGGAVPEPKQEVAPSDPPEVGADDFHPSEPRRSRGHTIASAHEALSSTGLIASGSGGPNTYAPRAAESWPASEPSRGCLGQPRYRTRPQDLEWPFPPTKLGRAWCEHCQIWKPDRAHHCRHCGQCVLAMDHHCPWVGQCVGWKNRKFFVIFCGWSTLFTAYVMAVLIASMAKSSTVDGQMIALAAIAGFFTIFTVMMTISQVQLMATALTTIESYGIRSQRDRERAALAAQYGFCGYGKKIKAKKKWQREWGDMATEGNRWWTGGWTREIQQVMGDNRVGWFLPFGRPMGDGATYDQNPRFGPGGIRRKREEWPEALR